MRRVLDSSGISCDFYLVHSSASLLVPQCGFCFVLAAIPFLRTASFVIFGLLYR